MGKPGLCHLHPLSNLAELFFVHVTNGNTDLAFVKLFYSVSELFSSATVTDNHASRAMARQSAECSGVIGGRQVCERAVNEPCNQKSQACCTFMSCHRPRKSGRAICLLQIHSGFPLTHAGSTHRTDSGHTGQRLHSRTGCTHRVGGKKFPNAGCGRVRWLRT